jgi:hypothetical protein
MQSERSRTCLGDVNWPRGKRDGLAECVERGVEQAAMVAMS